MKKQDLKNNDQEQDEKTESRIGLKNKLYNNGCGNFDLSLFTQSNNQQQRFSNMFPQVNEPTLQDSEPGSNIKIGDDSSLQQYYGEGVTARNSYQKSKSGNSHIIQLEMNIDQLNLKVELQEAELLKLKNTKEHLQQEVQRLRKGSESKDKIIERQKNQINNLKFKQSMSSQYSSKQSSSRSVLSQSINQFCPQMLSPDQTSLLLSQLLKKASKSVRLLRYMSQDPCMKQILAKISKN